MLGLTMEVTEPAWGRSAQPSLRSPRAFGHAVSGALAASVGFRAAHLSFWWAKTSGAGDATLTLPPMLRQDGQICIRFWPVPSQKTPQ